MRYIALTASPSMMTGAAVVGFKVIVPLTGVTDVATSMTFLCTVTVLWRFSVASAVAPSETRRDPHVGQVVTTTATRRYTAGNVRLDAAAVACIAVLW